VAIAKTKAGIEKSVVGNEEGVGCVSGVGSDKANTEVSSKTGEATFAAGVVD
jgi:hypothetical protein